MTEHTVAVPAPVDELSPELIALLDECDPKGETPYGSAPGHILELLKHAMEFVAALPPSAKVTVASSFTVFLETDTFRRLFVGRMVRQKREFSAIERSTMFRGIRIYCRDYQSASQDEVMVTIGGAS